MQNVIMTVYDLVCRQSQFNIAFQCLHATETGGLEAWSFQ